MAITASPDVQALLLDLQALDTRLQQLAHRAKSLPQHAALAALDGERTGLLATLATRTGEREDTETELARIESDVAVVEARIARDAERLQGSSSVKDVAALEQELGALRSRLADLEEIELAVMERLEVHQLAETAARSFVDDIAGRAETLVAERDAALAELETERASASANRQAIAATIPGDLLALYEKQRDRYGFGASHLRGGVSSASGVKLLENEMAIIRAAAPDAVLLCPDSNAILVRTAESGI